MFKWLSSFFGKHQITELEKVPKGTSSSTGKRRLPKGPDSCYLDPNKCYRCGRPATNGCFEEVTLYKNVRVGKRYPEVEFDQKLLKMPLCAECCGHEVEHSWGFYLYLQEKGYRSWHVGLGPSKDEIESVWHLHNHPPRDLWGEALEQQKREANESRIRESHVKDKAVAIIDQYEILKQLGEGGFGAVCLARDTISKTLIAVKGLPDKVSDAEKDKEDLRRNFALIANLHHPNIASPLALHSAAKTIYYDTSIEKSLRIHPGDMFFVMEFVHGETLMEWRKKQDCNALRNAAVEIVTNVAEALDFAHSKGVLHRDIKPSNIIVYWNRDKQELEVKVLDFGIAASLKESMQRLECQPQCTAGTIPYMAPEQWRKEKLGVGTDIYALTVVAHQFLFNAIPFEETFLKGDINEIYRCVCEKDVMFSSQIWPEMERVLRRGMAKKLRDRYFSCREFAEEFSKAVKALPNNVTTTDNSKKDWEKQGNILEHPLVKSLSELNWKPHQVGHSIFGFINDFELNKFWNYLSILIRNISPYRLTHANEVLSLDFYGKKSEEEQVISDIANKIKADITAKYLEKVREEKFKEAWNSIIHWATLMGEVLVSYSINDEGVLESMRALKQKLDQFEEEEKNKNVTVGNMKFVGNPFYRRKLTPEIILCEYYLEMGSK